MSIIFHSDDINELFVEKHKRLSLNVNCSLGDSNGSLDNYIYMYISRMEAHPFSSSQTLKGNKAELSQDPLPYTVHYQFSKWRLNKSTKASMITTCRKKSTSNQSLLQQQCEGGL